MWRFLLGAYELIHHFVCMGGGGGGGLQ